MLKEKQSRHIWAQPEVLLDKGLWSMEMVWRLPWVLFAFGLFVVMVSIVPNSIWRWYLLFNIPGTCYLMFLPYHWVFVSKDGIQMLKWKCIYRSLSPGALFLVVMSIVHVFSPECRWIAHSPIISQPYTSIICKVDVVTHTLSIPFKIQYQCSKHGKFGKCNLF